MKKFLVLILSLALVSCSWNTEKKSLGFLSYSKRSIANQPDLSRLEFLLSVDKFDYYITEYVNNFGKHIDEVSINILKNVDPQYILRNYQNDSRIKDAKKYDDIIYEIISSNRESMPLPRTNYSWGYNFFKNKVNEGYTLATSNMKLLNRNLRLAPYLKGDLTQVEAIEPINFSPENLTLESGHYISNRTTRAVFWEATESGRDIDFHLENSREFLKDLAENDGVVIKEIKPFANNYNKMFVVQYPGDSTYRYAITNIGGQDRLKHLLLQFNLSNISGGQLSNKVRIFGDVDKTHKYIENELTGIFKHMKKADRVIIGQKGAIERTLGIMWQVRALKNLYDQKPNVVKEQFDPKNWDDVLKFLTSGDYKEYDLFKNKKEIVSAFKKLEKKIESLGLMPDDFKLYEYDNFVISMADFAFKNSEGKDVTWRVVANSWGDEIAPLAYALKNSGHRHITYIGTAGAFPEKGYKVGDLVIPTHARYEGQKSPLKGTALDVPGAKIGGAVDHVYSPFVETEQWFNETKPHSDFVEVETGYLRKVFNSNDFDFRAYLLISDILKSEDESLASATSAKRRNALNKLIYAMMDRDKLGIPSGVDIDYGHVGELREDIVDLIPKKGKTFQYYILSSLKDQDQVSSEQISSFIKQVDNFSDNYFIDRLVESSEALSHLARKIEAEMQLPIVSIDKEFIEGKWHPKNDKIVINFHANNAQTEQQIKEIIARESTITTDVAKWMDINVVRGPPSDDFVSFPKYASKDSDHLVSLYSQASFRQGGLDAQVTYNGNVKFNFLPTTKMSDVCEAGKFCYLSFFKPNATTKNLLVDLDTHEKLKALTGEDMREVFEREVEDLSQELKYRAQGEDYQAVIKVNKNADLPNGNLAQLRPSYDEQKGLVINIDFTTEGYKNPMVVAEEMIHLRQIIDGHGYFQNPIFWAEVSLNANYGSKRSKYFNSLAEVDVMDGLQNYFQSEGVMNDKIQAFINARREHAQKIAKVLKSEVRVENKFRKGISATWKTFLNELQKQDLKLDDYIAANDRGKTADLIQAYMPWEEMEPTEIAAWTRWLDVIRNPDPSKEMITFRGIGNDLVRESNDGGNFLMAKLLTKNQGNYTRRLRSLKTFFKKKMAKKAESEIPTDIRSLAGIFKAHSHEPLGSPFLSTSVLDVAEGFAGSDHGGDQDGKLAAIKIDERRNLINLVSDYGELEQMVPLIVFPDEIVHIADISDGTEGFEQVVEEKIGRSIKDIERERDNSGALEKSATKEWWSLVNPEGITEARAEESCKDIVRYFLSN